MNKEKLVGKIILAVGFVWLNLITNPWAGVAVLLILIGFDILTDSSK